MAKKESITVDELRQLLRYENGKVYRLVDSGTRWRAGQEAFAGDKGHGYLAGSINGHKLYAHRVIWALHYGGWPKGEIDHLNGQRDDNRIENLRDVDSLTNRKNMPMFRHNTSGVTGVSWSQERQRWVSFIQVGGKLVYLGRHHSFEAACEARWAAERKYGFTERHGKPKAA